jgi:DNA-binding IclR family transcriptional regulator
MFRIMESTVLVKAFALLEALAGTSAGATLGEIAAATQQTKPTVHRILRSLAAMGYVDHVDGGRYRITDKLRQLGLNCSDRNLVSRARPALESLRERTGETVNLGVLRHNRIAYLLTLESAHALRRVADSDTGGGGGDPLFTTALGRAIAAHLPVEERDRLLRIVPVERRTPRTVSEPAALQTILEHARRDGYAVERDQTDLGVTCCSAPVFAGTSVVAAISISAPSARAEGCERAWIRWLRAAAAELSRSLTGRERATA